MAHLNGSGNVDLEDFLSTHHCNGPVARMLRANLGRVSQALHKNQAAFRAQVAGGASLNRFLRVADSILKDGRKHAGQRGQSKTG